MTGRFKSLACVAVLVVALTPTAARESDTAQKMRTAAAAFDQDARRHAAAAGHVHVRVEERLNWHFMPRTQGTSGQGDDARAAHGAGGAAAHRPQRQGIREGREDPSLEHDLIVIEQGKNPLRDHDGYYLSVFGTPGADKPWGGGSRGTTSH